MSNRRLPRLMETQREILRSYTKEDASWYYQMSLRNRDHLRRYESGNLAMSLASEEDTKKTLETVGTYWKEGVC